MKEEGKITMSEFRTVVEDFNSKLNKVVEVVNHKFDKVESGLARQGQKIDSLMQQVALLHEGQTEIKAELKNRVTYEDFASSH